MKAIGTKLALQAALVLIFLGSAIPLHAQEATAGATLYIYNKGTVPVQTAVAFRTWDVARGFGKYYWLVAGRIDAPQSYTTVQIPDGEPAYIAFGFTDSKGKWGSGSIAQVPDLGTAERNIFTRDKVLTGATKVMCARKDANYYAIDDDFTADCSSFTLTGGLDTAHDRGHGPFLPLTSALYFHPSAQLCHNDQNGLPAPCDWTYYYINIFPSATDRELHATLGTESDADAAAKPSGVNTPAAKPEDSVGMQLLKALAKAAAEDGQKQNQAAAAAAAERQRQAQAAEAQRQSEAAATAPAAPPPPAAAPSSPPASSPDDDPIGSGGFITPPDSRIKLCVQAGMIQLDHDSWNMPVIDGKMIAFQHFIGSYILSVAQPGWLYGITDQAYARFDPAAASDPAGFVSPIPPDRQATPGNCPGDYSTFWLQRKQ